MPVRKFRSVEEMGLPWRRLDDPALTTVIAAVWEFADRTCPRSFPPGIHKHRSIEDAQDRRREWEEANFRAYWERQERARRARGHA